MTKPAAFKASYADWKIIRGRKVVSICFEVPLEMSDAAYQVLGGMPIAASERWFGIAAIDNVVAERKEKQEPNRFVQRAGILCTDELFQSFLRTEWPMNWVQQEGPEEDRAAAVLRQLCEVKSRKELATNLEAQACFDNLLGRFEGWKRGIE